MKMPASAAITAQISLPLIVSAGCSEVYRVQYKRKETTSWRFTPLSMNSLKLTKKLRPAGHWHQRNPWLGMLNYSDWRRCTATAYPINTYWTAFYQTPPWVYSSYCAFVLRSEGSCNDPCFTMACCFVNQHSNGLRQIQERTVGEQK